MLKIGNYFENFLKKDSFFMKKNILLPAYIPEKVVYREEQLQEVAHILAPALRLEKPSNLFIYGKTGTGKTLSVQHVLHSMQEIADKNSVPFLQVYVNCKLKRVADTEYRLLSCLIRELGRKIPSTGLPTDEVYNIFYSLLDSEERMVLLVLDEVDQLTKKIGDEILYNLTRINTQLKNASICLIGISNNLVFAEHLDPRVKSSLSEEEIVFPPYNALQIQEILRERCKLAFRDNSVLPGVIEKCSAYAARQHGDVRRAIDLLRVAGEIAERSGSREVAINHLDEAECKVESDKIIHAAMSQPKQFQTVLYSVLLVLEERKKLFTGEIYVIYTSLCKKHSFNVLTQRRVSDILAELDMLGLITAKIISKGRYGRTREVSLSLTQDITYKLRELLEKSLRVG